MAIAAPSGAATRGGGGVCRPPAAGFLDEADLVQQLVAPLEHALAIPGGPTEPEGDIDPIPPRPPQSAAGAPPPSVEAPAQSIGR